MSEREFERKVKEWLDKGYSNSDVIHTIECNYLGTCIVDIKCDCLAVFVEEPFAQFTFSDFKHVRVQSIHSCFIQYNERRGI